MTSYQIGAQMYSVRDMCQDYNTMLSAMKVLKDGGYNICQLSGFSKDLKPEQLKELCDESGLKCASTHISFADMEQNLDEVIRMHKLLDCEYPGIGGMPTEFRGSEEGFAAFAKRAGEIAKKLEAEGLHFIYHSHHFEFERLKSGRFGYDILLENSPKELQFELDVFWAQAGGQNVLEWIKKLEGRMDVIHFKDMGIGFKGMPIVPIGEGSMDFASIMKAAEDIGVKYAFIEQDTAPEYPCGSIACMMRSKNALEKLGGWF